MSGELIFSTTGKPCRWASATAASAERATTGRLTECRTPPAALWNPAPKESCLPRRPTGETPCRAPARSSVPSTGYRAASDTGFPDSSIRNQIHQRTDGVLGRGKGGNARLPNSSAPVANHSPPIPDSQHRLGDRRRHGGDRPGLPTGSVMACGVSKTRAYVDLAVSQNVLGRAATAPAGRPPECRSDCRATSKGARGRSIWLAVCRTAAPTFLPSQQRRSVAITPGPPALVMMASRGRSATDRGTATRNRTDHLIR